jgi:hypothetical protein
VLNIKSIGMFLGSQSCFYAIIVVDSTHQIYIYIYIYIWRERNVKVFNKDPISLLHVI